MAVRQVIKIDEELCNGCGACVPSCAEGAIQIVGGKARLVSDKYCDGLGACLGECPEGALTFETREAEEFDEEAAIENVKSLGREVDPNHHHHHQAPAQAQAAHANHGHAGHVCPSARTIDRTREVHSEVARQDHIGSELRQWPVKLYLVNPAAPYLEDADLLIAADCTAFAFGAFHPELLRGKTLVTGCPKFDDTQVYAEKLTEIVSRNNIKSITVVQMEVPCCSGMTHLARHAVEASGKGIPVETVTISLEGEPIGRTPVMA